MLWVSPFSLISADLDCFLSFPAWFEKASSFPLGLLLQSRDGAFFFILLMVNCGRTLSVTHDLAQQGSFLAGFSGSLSA